MMQVTFKRPRGFNTEGSRIAKQIRTYVTTRLVQGLEGFQQSIMNTPVYTGRTLVNYRWSLGSAETSTRAAIKDPTLPGVTSDLPVGTEPRRSANASVVETEFQSMIGRIRSNPFQKIFLNNNVEHFSEIEYGTYAVKSGKGSRTPPGGMTRRGEAYLQNSLEGVLRLVS